ncbi:MAG: hypothetical protein ACIAXF_07450 [Phycisphaerales bacterium JB063]
MDQQLGTSRPTWIVHSIGGSVCAVFLGIGYLFGAMPLMSDGDTPTDMSAVVRDAEQQAALQDAVTQRLSQELAHSEQELESRPMQLVQSSYANRRVAALSALAYDFGLTLASTQPGGETMMTYYAYVPVTIGGEGSLADFVRFLGALHTRFPDMGVQGFEIVRDSKGGGRFALSLNWFVEPTQTAEAS